MIDLSKDLGGRRYKLILADPPWPYNERNNSNTLFGTGSTGKYGRLSIEEIAAMNIEDIADPTRCVLFMWTTWYFIVPALTEVIPAWGFDYKTCGFLWVKTNKKQMRMLKKHREMTADDLWQLFNKMMFRGPGNYTMSNTEPCLVATRGEYTAREYKDVGQVVLYPRSQHSRKPGVVRDKIVRMYGNVSRVELFATEKVSGWDGWGDMYPS